MKPEKMFRLILALLLAAALVAGTAGAEGWQAAEKNVSRFGTLLNLLRDSLEKPLNTAAAEAVLEEIRNESAADYAVGRAILEHWNSTVLDPGYRMFVWNGEQEAAELRESGLDFSGRHAFVVLGYQLEDGKMTAELTGRCEAAAAAARAFPEAVLVCTGGATGINNPNRHTEAGEMKKYLVQHCGISAERIFTDQEATITLDNAVNGLKILHELGVESMTVVTSDYHQRWGQILFNAVAAVYAEMTGTTIRIVGNYNYAARPKADRTFGCRAGLNQMRSLFKKKIDPDE